MTNPLVFILSWERPLYLWACLDSLRRTTRTNCRFVLLDNASSDPLVHAVIDSFETRGFFHRVYRRTENSPYALTEALAAHKKELGGYFVYIESDVALLPANHCWLGKFMELCRANPDIAMLGSLVDKSDFVDPAWAAGRFVQMDAKRLDFLIKGKSPERQLEDNPTEELIDPFNPPGRLLMLKTEFIDKVGDLPDRAMYREAKRLGYRAAIATHVRHRHLSLQNIFDYPNIDIDSRNNFFKTLEKGLPK